MPSKSVMIKIAALAGLGTGIVILVAGVLWDNLPFNRYSGVFWMVFLPLILFFMQPEPKRKSLINLICSFVVGLVFGLIAILAIQALAPLGYFPLTFVLDFIIVGIMVFLHNGPLEKTVFNMTAASFLGFAETMMCLSTSFSSHGEMLAPMAWNGIDMLIIFLIGIVITFFVSLVGDLLVGKFIMSKLPAGRPE